MQNVWNNIDFDFFVKHLQTSVPQDFVNAMMPKGRITTPDHTNPPRKSAVLILFYPDENTIYFPLIRRPKYNGAHSGQMAFPGGKMENSDTDLIETALRETCEEIGVCINRENVLGTLSKQFIPITNMQVLPVIAFLPQKPEFVLDKTEVEQLFLMDIATYLKPENKKLETWNLRGNDVDIPFYLMQNQKVWGATAIILNELEHYINSF